MYRWRYRLFTHGREEFDPLWTEFYTWEHFQHQQLGGFHKKSLSSSCFSKNKSALNLHCSLVSGSFSRQCLHHLDRAWRVCLLHFLQSSSYCVKIILKLTFFALLSHFITSPVPERDVSSNFELSGDRSNNSMCQAGELRLCLWVSWLFKDIKKGLSIRKSLVCGKIVVERL